MPGWLILLHRGLVNILHPPNIHRFLHLPRGLVYIYSRPKSVYDRVTWGSGGYLPTTSPYAYTSLEMARSPIDYTNIDGGTHVRIFSQTFFKNRSFQKNFGPFCEGPWRSTPASSNSSPRATHPGIFSRLPTSTLTKRFIQALPTSTATPTPTPSSCPPPRGTYPMIFSRLSPSVLTDLTKGFTQSLPTPNVTPTLIPPSHPPPRVTYLGIFSRLSTSILTLAFTQALPPPTLPLHQHHVLIPLLVVRTPRFSPASLPQF